MPGSIDDRQSKRKKKMTAKKIRILIRWNELRRAQAKSQADKMDAEGKLKDFQFAQLDNYQSKRIADLESENQHLKNEVE